ncbi:MAG: FtsW/RodA/SpoVE family cell cycle protein, partial [Ktedonobacteraceae bacterium]
MASQSPGRFRRYRWKELSLFIIPSLILLIGMTQVLLATRDKTSSLTGHNLPTIQGLIPVLGLIILFVLVNMLFSFFFPKVDQVLLPLVGLMSGLGVIMALRIGPNLPFPDPTLGTKQLVWVMVGIIVCIATLFGLRKMNWLERYKYTWAILGILLVGITLGNTLRVKDLNSPTHDQLKLGFFQLQPSELLKICIVIFFAAYLSENRDILAGRGPRFGSFRLPPLRQLGPIFTMLGISL